MHTIVVRLNVLQVCIVESPQSFRQTTTMAFGARCRPTSRLLAYLLGKIRRGERCAACDCDDDPPSFSFSFPLPIFVALSDRPRLRCSPVYVVHEWESEKKEKKRKAHPVSPLHSCDASYRLHSCASRSSLAFGRPSSPPLSFRPRELLLLSGNCSLPPFSLFQRRRRRKKVAARNGQVASLPFPPSFPPSRQVIRLPSLGEGEAPPFAQWAAAAAAVRGGGGGGGGRAESRKCAALEAKEGGRAVMQRRRLLTRRKRGKEGKREGGWCVCVGTRGRVGP